MPTRFSFTEPHWQPDHTKQLQEAMKSKTRIEKAKREEGWVRF